MKYSLPTRFSDHLSYKQHRKQIWTQILLPVLTAVLVLTILIVFTCIATFRGQGDVNRWAAISTIWLILPVMAAGLIFLILLIGMIYLLSRLIKLIPPYSFQAQRFVYRVENLIKRYAEFFRKPKLAIQEIASLVRSYIKSVRKTNSSHP